MNERTGKPHGKVSITGGHGVRVHTYTAPEDGWAVNTHFVELPTQLIAIDGQYTIPYAKEALAYAATLAKPVTRLYVSHYHPDHLLGAAAFGLPIHALPEVKAKIDAVGDRVASEEHEKFPDAIPTRAEKPSLVVMPGNKTIDGVRFEFLHLQHAETEHALVIGLPEHRILITQDLIYNGVHAFIGERAFDTWFTALQYFKTQPYDRILPGHGAPGGRELYDHIQNYLSTARELLTKSSDGDDLKARLIAAFPEFCGHPLLDHQKRFLFPSQKEAKA
jgi:glyoxylase-like metal-dependent hydrolase (beta-lactamase superfamily II)